MTVLTRERGQLLDRLIDLAGDSEIVRIALVQLNAELAEAPTVEQVIRRIVVLRDALKDAQAADAR